MNLLKSYSKLSRLTYRSVRSFVASKNNSTGTSDTSAQNQNKSKTKSSTKASAQDDTSSVSSNIGSNNPSTLNYDNIYRQADVSSSDTSSAKMETSKPTTTKHKGPEHFISTDTQFNAFNNSGPTSGFSGKPEDSTDDLSTDMGTAAKEFVDYTASNVKEMTDRAVNTTKNFVNSTGKNSTDPNSFTNSATSAAQGIVTNTADAAGSALKGLADAASSVASNFVPNDRNSDNRNNDYRQNDYRNRSRDDNRYRDSNDNSITGTMIRSATDLGNMAASIASSFIPGSSNRRDNRDNTDNSIAGTIVRSAMDLGNVAASVASNFIPGASNMRRDNRQNDNYDSRYQGRDNRYQERRDNRDNTDNSIAGTIVKSAMDLGNIAASVASSFIPGASNTDRRDNRQNSDYDFRYQGRDNRSRDRSDNRYENRSNNFTDTVVGPTLKGLNNIAGSVVSTFIPGTQTSQQNYSSRRDGRYNNDNNSSSKTENTNPTGADFMYTGSQVEDMTFSDANKQGQVSSGDISEEMMNSVRNYAQTARAVAEDAFDIASSTGRKFSSEATKGAISAANNFVTTAGDAALSAAASAIRSFNSVASSTDSASDDAQQGFIYTGTQVKEDLQFTQTENQGLMKNMSAKAARRSRPASYDIVISGAGINGSALACALAHYRYFTKEDKKILLLDPREVPSLEDFQKNDTVPDQRVVSLSLSSVNFLKELGVWSLLNRNRIGSIHQMQVWEAGGNSFIKFNEDPSREIGYVVEIGHLQAALHERLRSLENVQIETSSKITDLKTNTDNFATVVLQDEEKISARLVVGSDGVNSVVKKKAKISSTGWSSLQHGIICTVKTHIHNTTAWQRFLTTGPLALLPLWENYSSVIWSCESSLHQALMQHSDEDFLKELNYSLSRRGLVDTPNIVVNPNAMFDLPPPVTEICNQRKSFPLGMQQSNQYVAQRIALIGDAAHNIHPLAGQGLNLGLTDAAYLANTIIKNIKAGNDIGNPDFLKEYEASSMNLNTTMLYSLEFIKRSYESNNYSSVVLARNLATSVLNNLSPVKSLFIDIANGKYFQPTDYEWKTVG